MQALRGTAGACKIEYLLQTLTRPRLTSLSPTAPPMCGKRAQLFSAKTLTTWAHAARPQRKRGFGLRDPKTIADTVQLGSLVNVAQRALGLGAAKSYIDMETEKAIVNYVAKLVTGLRSDLPSPSLLEICKDAESATARTNDGLALTQRR